MGSVAIAGGMKQSRKSQKRRLLQYEGTYCYALAGGMNQSGKHRKSRPLSQQFKILYHRLWHYTDSSEVNNLCTPPTYALFGPWTMARKRRLIAYFLS
jgi:hypothetical protein